MDLGQGDEQVIKIANSLKDQAKLTAKEMLAAGKQVAPLLSPDGDPLLYLVTDKSQLRAAFTSVEVDATTVFVGLLADELSSHA